MNNKMGCYSCEEKARLAREALYKDVYGENDTQSFERDLGKDSLNQIENADQVNSAYKEFKEKLYNKQAV